MLLHQLDQHGFLRPGHDGIRELQRLGQARHRQLGTPDGDLRAREGPQPEEILVVGRGDGAFGKLQRARGIPNVLRLAVQKKEREIVEQQSVGIFRRGDVFEGLDDPARHSSSFIELAGEREPLAQRASGVERVPVALSERAPAKIVHLPRDPDGLREIAAIAKDDPEVAEGLNAVRMLLAQCAPIDLVRPLAGRIHLVRGVTVEAGQRHGQQQLRPCGCGMIGRRSLR